MDVISRKTSILVMAMVGVTLFACKEVTEQQQASLGNTRSKDVTRDRVEILDLLNRHQIYLDLYDDKRMASVYSNDALYDGPFGTAHGTRGLIAMFEQVRKSGIMAGKRHFNGPVMIDISGDQAIVVSNWWVAKTTSPPVVDATGTYRDKLRRIDGQWKIVHRVQTQDSDVRHTSMK